MSASYTVSHQPLLFSQFRAQQVPQGYELLTDRGRIRLTALQFQYLDFLRAGKSTKDLVEDYLRRGWLVHFAALLELLEKLAFGGVIVNPEVVNYFTNRQAPDFSRRWLSSAQDFFFGPRIPKNFNVKSLGDLPFFRSLQQPLREFLLSRVQVLAATKNLRLLKKGDKSRDLFVLIQGEAGVFNQKLVARVPAGSIFGEGGFLLGQPRSADVFALSPCLVGRIPFDSSVEAMIQPEKAKNLQRRFWVLHALMQSELFKQVSTEALDRFIFLGQVREFQAGSTIVQEGQPGTSLFVIIQGQVGFSKDGQSIRTLSQGDIFGEIALMISGGVRTATATALSTCLLLEIGQDEFYKALAEDLFLAAEVEKIAISRYS